MGHILLKCDQILPCHVQKYSSIIHSFILSKVALCVGSVIYLILFAPKLFGHASTSKSLPHEKIQLHLPSQSSSMIIQSFRQTYAIVKEVLVRSIQLSWNLACLFMCSYNSPPSIFSPIPSSMWAQDQIFDSVNIFRLWSNYILYCFILAENLPEHSHDHKTSLHQFWDQFIKPIFL